MKRLFTPQWIDPEPVTIPAELRAALPGSELFLQTLVRRGLTDPEKALAFLDPDRYIPTSAAEMPDMALAVARLQHALLNHERIGVWGDFDVDGQTSTTVLVSAFRFLGADVRYHIPVRKTESHGIKLEYLQEFLAQGIQLLLTCDTGISARDEIVYAQEHGVEVILTDHHSLPPQLPPALAVINPQRLPEEHPLRSLSGVGAAYKLVEALCAELGKPEFPPTLLDLVALGLIADLATLTADTLYLAQRGLQQLQRAPRPALAKILNENNVVPAEVSEETVSFIIAPRMNAVGRLSDANPMVEFLLTDDPVKLATQYAQIEGLNAQRKLECDLVYRGAQAQIEQTPQILERPILILAHSEWEAGVVGIVASRLVEQYHRPAILLNIKDEAVLSGSCRSIEGINITQAIRENSRCLLGFGGHPMAAGLSLKLENFSEFQHAMYQTIQRMVTENAVSPAFPIDAYVSPEMLDLDAIREISRLAPFGPGNPPLRFAIKEAEISETRLFGKTKEHLEVILHTSSGQENCFTWWQGAGRSQPEGKFDLLYQARISTYSSQPKVVFEWEEFRETADAPSQHKFKPSSIQIVDFRRTPPSPAEILALVQDPTCLCWAEGTIDTPFSALTRWQLQACSKLVLWGLPPSLQILNQALQKTSPRTIYWFSHLPAESSLKALIEKSAVSVKRFLAQHSAAPINITLLAAETATTPALARLILLWLEATGNLHIDQENENEFFVSAARSAPEPTKIAHLQARIKTLYTETAEFRSYLQATDSLELLISS